MTYYYIRDKIDVGISVGNPLATHSRNIVSIVLERIRGKGDKYLLAHERRTGVAVSPFIPRE